MTDQEVKLIEENEKLKEIIRDRTMLTADVIKQMQPWVNKGSDMPGEHLYILFQSTLNRHQELVNKQI